MNTFKIVKPIASGGFGRVEQVELADGTACARKIFSPSMNFTPAERTKQIARFAREVKIQSSLNRDFVIPVLDCDLTLSEPWYIMPLADRTYEKQIAEDKASGKLTVDALVDLLNALEEIHRLGYTHRDLKPSNVLLHDGKWKLSDFGLALPPQGTTTQLTTNSAWGTRDYCAPEQIRGFHGVGPAADIYAFGCILHDIYGDTRVPYSRATASGSIGRVIEKCTEPSLAKRFSTIAALRSTLLTVLRSSSSPILSTAQGTQWIDALSSIASWNRDKGEDFVRYIEGLGDGETEPVFSALESEHLSLLLKQDEDLANAVAERYCTWVQKTSFTFSFCDVIIYRLLTILREGSLTARARAALAAAELGSYHSRWYVMGIVLRELGPSLEEALAERIALEIAIEDAKADFKKCAATIGQSASAYHPLIAAALKK